jgi:small subunit ribosomal protein S6
VVLRGGGVIRGFTNWGVFLLPKPRTKHQTKYHNGHYFIMRFDSSAKVQHSVRRTLSIDPRLLRYTMVKMGNTLEEIKDIPGKAKWPGTNVGNLNGFAGSQM